MLAAMFGFNIHAVDVSQAFPPIDPLRPKGRFAILQPRTIQLQRKGELYSPETNLRALPPPTHGFLILKPLYGAIGASLRWFVRLASVLTRAGLIQMETDICMYSSANDNQLQGISIAHVDGLLYAGGEKFIQTVEKAINRYRIGEFDFPSRPIAFAWLEIERGPRHSTILSQYSYTMSSERWTFQNT